MNKIFNSVSQDAPEKPLVASLKDKISRKAYDSIEEKELEYLG